MLVTLIVDASFYGDTRAAAYALYAISARSKLTFSGRFKQPIKDSTHAELAAIANALHIIMPHPVAAGARKILIQSDSQSAIKWLEERSCPKHPAVLSHVLGLLAKWGVQAEYRHVKAHSGTSEPRKWCHDWCDKEARRLAKAMHAERLNGTPKITKKILETAFPMPPKKTKKPKVGKPKIDKA